MPEFSAPDGTRLHFTDEGEGPPILCLAGLTRNGNDFGYVTPHLNRNRLIRMDYRGRGKSEWTDHATYSIPNEAADALALLDHLGIERAAILGTSRGGLIAMVIAATAKDRLTGVALNDIGPELMAEGLADIDAYLGRRPKAQTFEEAAAMRASLMPGFEGVPHSRWAEEVRIHYTNTADGLKHKKLRPGFAGRGRSGGNAARARPLAAIRSARRAATGTDPWEKLQLTKH